MTFRVIAVSKQARGELVLLQHQTMEQAEKFCEGWGWNYADENGNAYWLVIEAE